MSIKSVAAAVAVGAALAVAPGVVSAGGEIQAYEQSSYSASSAYGAGAYGAPAPMGYARPMAQYYGGYGCSPCASMPYGYNYGRPAGVGFGGDFLTAGLLGVGLGYLLFH